MIVNILVERKLPTRSVWKFLPNKILKNFKQSYVLIKKRKKTICDKILSSIELS